MALSAAERWAEQLRAWAIPSEILEAAPESPFGFPTELFRNRAVRATSVAPTPTTIRALEALLEGGTVLDVGVGGGATSLPLARRASLVTGVDDREEMLASFAEAAAAAGAEPRTILGRWPDVEVEAPVADVVVCGHVAYNVADLAPFARELDAHASRRVVMELTEHHPLWWMNDLWLSLHGVHRPDGPTADDAADVIRDLGVEPSRDERPDQSVSGFARRGDAVALVRRRLCLPPERDEQIAAALGERLSERGGLWSAGPAEQTVITLWWDTTS